MGGEGSGGARAGSGPKPRKIAVVGASPFAIAVVQSAKKRARDDEADEVYGKLPVTPISSEGGNWNCEKCTLSHDTPLHIASPYARNLPPSNQAGGRLSLGSCATS